MTWYLEPTYSALEVAIVVMLAILPGSQIATLLLSLIQQKTGLTLHREKRE